MIIRELYYYLPAEETSREEGGGTEIESERSREAEWRRINQEKESRFKKSKKKADCRSRVKQIEAREAESSRTAARKAK